MNDEWELCGWPMTDDIYLRRCNLPLGHGGGCAREYVNSLTYDVYRTHEWAGVNPP